jgi:DNA-binding GntR family transcriptional regulator
MPIPVKTKQINHSTMREEVYRTILEWIMAGELRPGEKLIDTDLAENLGVSRTPVREALRRLADKGLVETSASRWTRVTNISVEEAESIYPIIWQLEDLAIEMALPRITQSDLEKMRLSNLELEQAITTGDPVLAYQADARFHETFIDLSHNSHLFHILEDLKIKHRRLEVHYFGGSGFALNSVNEHTEIIKAINNQDLEQAQEMIRLNWKGSLKRLMEVTCSG